MDDIPKLCHDTFFSTSKEHIIPPKNNRINQPTMAKKNKNQTPSEASTPKRCKPSPSIVTPTKKLRRVSPKMLQQRSTQKQHRRCCRRRHRCCHHCRCRRCCRRRRCCHARDNGTILIEQNYPKEEEGEPRYFATRIVG